MSQKKKTRSSLLLDNVSFITPRTVACVTFHCVDLVRGHHLHNAALFLDPKTLQLYTYTHSNYL